MCVGLTTYVQVKDNNKLVSQCREGMKKPFRLIFFVSVYFSSNLSLFAQNISIFALMDKKMAMIFLHNITLILLNYTDE